MLREALARSLVPHALQAAVDDSLRRRPSRAFVLSAAVRLTDFRVEACMDAVLRVVLGVLVRAGFAALPPLERRQALARAPKLIDACDAVLVWIPGAWWGRGRAIGPRFVERSFAAGLVRRSVGHEADSASIGGPVAVSRRRHADACKRRAPNDRDDPPLHVLTLTRFADRASTVGYLTVRPEEALDRAPDAATINPSGCSPSASDFPRPDASAAAHS